jgi:hypothetical protein
MSSERKLEVDARLRARINAPYRWILGVLKIRHPESMRAQIRRLALHVSGCPSCQDPGRRPRSGRSLRIHGLATTTPSDRGSDGARAGLAQVSPRARSGTGVLLSRHLNQILNQPEFFQAAVTLGSREIKPRSTRSGPVRPGHRAARFFRRRRQRRSSRAGKGKVDTPGAGVDTSPVQTVDA